MNRIIAVLIAVCYLCASTGFTLHEHYCMGERVSTSLLEQPDAHKCEQCGMEKGKSRDGCCKDEHKVVKADGDATFSKAFLEHSPLPDAALPPLLAFTIADAVPFRTATESISGKPHGPPGVLSHSTPIYLRVRSFRI